MNDTADLLILTKSLLLLHLVLQFNSLPVLSVPVRIVSVVWITVLLPCSSS